MTCGSGERTSSLRWVGESAIRASTRPVGGLICVMMRFGNRETTGEGQTEERGGWLTDNQGEMGMGIRMKMRGFHLLVHEKQIRTTRDQRANIGFPMHLRFRCWSESSLSLSLPLANHTTTYLPHSPLYNLLHTAQRFKNELYATAARLDSTPRLRRRFYVYL
jgi:hypothetical protein